MRQWFAICLTAAACSVHAAPSPDLKRLDAVPMQALPVAPLQERIAQLQADPRSALRFAAGSDLPLSLDAGSWDSTEDGTARWRLRLFSASAQTLNVELERFELPPSARLWFYDAAGSVVQGPYTAADRSPEGRLWTALVPGETAVLELQVAAAEKDTVQLRLARVNHGFRGFERATGIPSKAGACNIDVVCPAGNEWRDEIRSVALYTVGGQVQCTGQLVNNARQDNAPLFLTADHCGVGEAGFPASSVTVYWNYQTSACGGSRNGSLLQNQIGSSLLADDVESDYTLLRLSRAPNTAYDVHYAGWNADSDVPQSGVAIHHPSGDEKSISVYNGALSRETVCIDSEGDTCFREVDAWEVQWDQGTTEQGSSGGGLWNEDHQLVGVLSGGLASCDTPNEFDYFGRLEDAWDAGLQQQLDPGAEGIIALAGRDPDEGDAPAEEDDGEGDGGGAVSLMLLAALLAAAGRRRQR